MPSIHWGYNRQWKVPASASARQHPRTKRAALCFQRVDEVTYYVTGSCAPVGNRRLLTCLQGGSGGLPTRRRLPTCPTTSAGFPSVGKLSDVGQDCLPHKVVNS